MKLRFLPTDAELDAAGPGEICKWVTLWSLFSIAAWLCTVFVLICCGVVQ